MPKKSLSERTDLVKRPITQKQDLSGKPFGQWNVIEYAGTKNGHWFKCRCSCGRIAIIHGGELRGHRSTNCGHDGTTYKHGKRRRSTAVAEYNAWMGMRDRCNNSNNLEYHRYGGRGIKVCERWNDFANFLSDMGPRPSRKHSIDRFPNNDGNYEPDNCRWAIAAEQRRNSSRIILVSHEGESLCLKDWCSRLGVSYTRIYQRIKRGQAPHEALFGKEV